MNPGRLPILALPALLLAGALLPDPAPAVASPLGPTRAVPTRAGLVGVPVTELPRRLAPPERIAPGGDDGYQHWLWGSGDERPAGLKVLSGLVVDVDDGFDPESHPAPEVVPGGPFLGQALADLLRARGPADEFAMFQMRSPIGRGMTSPRPYLVYDGRWVFVEDGLVVQITDPIPPQQSNGPGR